ncbi:RNA-dependent RNA polymerase 2 [Raphanus sativus]|uniref:RNA-dependent RNA polymerase n=1 Tax=Raphanus sativus TaxID=3726 RepID=A0A6J0LCI3_RAPSA|nr:RNA-dependent RNA polymerase 2 [Raphanus sativus]KAJ4876255.1 RNA-dependent RNA polymerase 2 [Raphanus sativus]
MVSETTRSTLKLTNVPQTIVADELLRFLELHLGADSVFALEIPTSRDNWKPRDFALVQFASLEAKSRARLLSSQSKLLFKSRNLRVSEAYDDIIPRPVDPIKRLDGVVLTAGFPEAEEGRFCALEKWGGVRCWVVEEKRRVELWVWESGDCYKCEVRFEDIVETVPCCVNGVSEINAFLLRLKYGPKIYKQVSGPNIATKFKSDRYSFCKEDFDFMWIRSTDFSRVKSIGTSTCFCLEVDNGSTMSDIFSSFPYYREDTLSLTTVDGNTFASANQIVPLLNTANLGIEIPYEILFQLNSLVHAQKISLFAGSDMGLISILCGLSLETALTILKKLHQQSSICYDPISFVKAHSQSVVKKKMAHSPASAYKRLTEQNIMSCQRAYVTPSKIYLLGPELETANYVVKNFAEHASDFMRITFVEEDWSKIPANALSVNSKEGYFVKPFRTNIYHRVLSVLGEGITVGPKKFEFLAFSASQLRGNSVWMFASNEKVKAEDIREWMGCFRKIRSISKCAARMGQLFSASRQTLNVRAQDVEQIPDIEVTTDGADYCFSDGIGKISLAFAKQVAQKCGLSHIPSAFQIRYGGYKGVIAVDRSSFRKLSLRDSMLKFDSNNRMLNVTRWTESMPCFLNREIICLLSTLGIEDTVFEAMQEGHLSILGNMLEDRHAALNVLQKLSGESSKNLLVKMLLQGYAPSSEPYLSMMLRVHHESQLSELKSRCRILVPKGRILIGCMDEMGILEYGQVYVRVTLTKAELESREQSYFRKIDEETSVVVGKVVVTKNPCLHPGDIRVLDAIYEVNFEQKGFLDCIVFPQKGERPHPNECSGGDLDGDQFFVSWDEKLIPSQMDPPMDYAGSRPRIMDHDVTLEEIHKFFVDYMISDTLGVISTAHLVHADRDPEKARSQKCIELANLHSRAVDFAKTGAPAEMPFALKPREFPDFLERFEKPTYISGSVFGKLYRAVKSTLAQRKPEDAERENKMAYDSTLEAAGFESFIETAKAHRDMYAEKLSSLMNYYGAANEEEILTGILRTKEMYLQRDNRRYGDMKDRITLSVKDLQREAMGWFEKRCEDGQERKKLASAWYYVTYNPSHDDEKPKFLSFPWIVGDVLLGIKAESAERETEGMVIA